MLSHLNLLLQETPREKKQATVKPMSVYEDRVKPDTAEAGEPVRHSSYITSVSLPHEKVLFDEGAELNSIKAGPVKPPTTRVLEHKQIVQEELDSRRKVAEETTADIHLTNNVAAINELPQIVSSSVSSQPSEAAEYRHRNSTDSQRSGSRASKSSQELDSNAWSEPDLIKDSKASSSPAASVVNLTSHVPSDPPVFHAPPAPVTQPVISAPQPQGRPASTSQPKFTPSPPPVPAPRPVKAESVKKSEIPIPRPRPEIQRVEPTIRQTVPASPDIPPKGDKRIDSHIPVPASRDREREELKKTIEIVRVEDSGSLRDDSSNLDHSSARSSQRSSLDRSDNASDNTESGHVDWEHSECSSDSSRPGRDTDTRASLSIDRKDSFNKKQTSSLFEEDLSAPSPQEIMSKLRERRLNRHLDHQRSLAGEGEASGVAAASRPRPSAREPQGIPGRASGVDTDEGGGGEGGTDEVDTNPLRMLRGGAIPIRTAGRGAAGE